MRSGSYAVPKENWSKKKFTEANFSKLVSYLLYTYLKKSTEKKMSEIYFLAKTQYEDLTGTGS